MENLFESKVSDIRYIKEKIGEYTVYIYFAKEVEAQLLIEAKLKGQPLTGTYSVTKHKPHTDGGQHHLHVHNKKNQIFAINKDGTAHDQSHGAVIPNRVADALRKKYPNWDIPANNLIESAVVQSDMKGFYLDFFLNE